MVNIFFKKKKTPNLLKAKLKIFKIFFQPRFLTQGSKIGPGNRLNHKESKSIIFYNKWNLVALEKLSK